MLSARKQTGTATQEHKQCYIGASVTLNEKGKKERHARHMQRHRHTHTQSGYATYSTLKLKGVGVWISLFVEHSLCPCEARAPTQAGGVRRCSARVQLCTEQNTAGEESSSGCDGRSCRERERRALSHAAVDGLQLQGVSGSRAPDAYLQRQCVGLLS